MKTKAQALWAIVFLAFAFACNAQVRDFPTTVRFGNVAQNNQPDSVAVFGSNGELQFTPVDSISTGVPNLQAVVDQGTVTENDLFPFPTQIYAKYPSGVSFLELPEEFGAAGFMIGTLNAFISWETLGGGGGATFNYDTGEKTWLASNTSSPTLSPNKSVFSFAAPIQKINITADVLAMDIPSYSSDKVLTATGNMGQAEFMDIGELGAFIYQGSTTTFNSNPFGAYTFDGTAVGTPFDGSGASLLVMNFGNSFSRELVFGSRFAAEASDVLAINDGGTWTEFTPKNQSVSTGVTSFLGLQNYHRNRIYTANVSDDLPIGPKWEGRKLTFIFQGEWNFTNTEGVVLNPDGTNYVSTSAAAATVEVLYSEGKWHILSINR